MANKYPQFIPILLSPSFFFFLYLSINTLTPNKMVISLPPPLSSSSTLSFHSGFLNPALYMYAEAMALGEEMPFASPSSSSSVRPSGHSRLHTSSSSSSSDAGGFLPPVSFLRDVTSGDNKCLKDPFLFCCPQGFTATEGWDPVTGEREIGRRKGGKGGRRDGKRISGREGEGG